VRQVFAELKSAPTTTQESQAERADQRAFGPSPPACSDCMVARMVSVVLDHLAERSPLVPRGSPAPQRIGAVAHGSRLRQQALMRSPAGQAAPGPDSGGLPNFGKTYFCVDVHAAVELTAGRNGMNTDSHTCRVPGGIAGSAPWYVSSAR
jgi:hypothetical protein